MTEGSQDQIFSAPNTIEAGRKSNFQNLLQLPLSGKDQLKTQIKKFNAKVRVFIHPYYSVNHSDNETKPSNITDSIDKIVRSTNMIPIIFFEENEFLEKTQERVRRLLGDSSKQIYFIETNSNTSNPKYDERAMRIALKKRAGRQ